MRSAPESPERMEKVSRSLLLEQVKGSLLERESRAFPETALLQEQMSRAVMEKEYRRSRTLL